MSIETVKYPGVHLQPGIVEMDLLLTGTGASAPTAVSAADADNRMVSVAPSRSAAGAYTLTLGQCGRVFLGAHPTFNAASGGMQLGHANVVCTTGVLTVRLYDAAGTPADLADGDTLKLVLRFKNSGAQ